MRDFWMEADYTEDKLHNDWLTSLGATIQMLEYMWRLDEIFEGYMEDDVVV